MFVVPSQRAVSLFHVGGELMPNLTAQQMLARLPVRMAEGGALDAPGVSAAYRAAMEKGGQQTVNDYYANLRTQAADYLSNPNAPTGVDAYNILVQSGISTSDLKNAGVADAVLNKIFTVAGPIEQSKFTTPAGMTSAYERSPDLINEAQRLSALGQDGRVALDTQGRSYLADLQKDGISPQERAQMLEYATERGYTFQDYITAGVDPNVLFTQRAAATPPPPPPPPTGGPTTGGPTTGGPTTGGPTTFPTLPIIPAYTPPVVTPQTQTQYPQPTPYTPVKALRVHTILATATCTAQRRSCSRRPAQG